MTNIDGAAGGALDFRMDEASRFGGRFGASRTEAPAAVRQCAVFIDEEALLHQRRCLAIDACHLDLAASARVALFRLGALDYTIVVVARRAVLPSVAPEARELALRELCEEFGTTLGAIAWCMPSSELRAVDGLVGGPTPADAMEDAARRFRIDLANSWVIARDGEMLDGGLCVGARVVSVGDETPDPAYAGSARDIGAAVRLVDDAARMAEAAGGDAVEPMEEAPMLQAA